MKSAVPAIKRFGFFYLLGPGLAQHKQANQYGEVETLMR
jgi:hypothetical protein